ncbi:MAG: DUF1549 and DUF1553 domain-containing protein [Verrucomicrobiales bacterium]
MIRKITALVAAALAATTTAQRANAEAQPPLWSLSAPAEQPPPAVTNTNWPIKPLDRFILAKIEQAGEQPSAPADRRTLAHRAYRDLHGLPPTTEQVQAFVSDNRPDAWSRLVDSLLSSPRYGERWGRHWLDIARYADSNGMDENIAHPNAYRYRDFVITAFNDDKPFDQFIIEQLAGDLLPAESLEQKRRQTIAAGFLSVGPKMLACDDPDKMRRDIVDEQIDTTGRAFLGLTLGCARCHDHKFDPVSIEDYYGLAGIFMSTKTLTKYSVVAKIHQHDLSPLVDKAKREQIAALEKRKDPISALEIDRLRKGLPPRFEIMAVTEYPTEDSRVNLRGDYQTLGELVPRRLPVSIAGGGQAAMPAEQSGRLELARWIASPHNPLTARVIANRIWRWHFGRGIVATTDNFGILGEPPSHPALLDHLALKLIEDRWSLKALHREIMASATYQQSSRADQGIRDDDPENLLFARWLPRRAESELIRDSILFKSDRLDLSSRGPDLVVRPNKYADGGKLAEYHARSCRSVYLPVLRSSGYDAQNAFDFPDPAVICGHRRTSSASPQALFLMNSPLVHKSSEHYSGLLLQKTPGATSAERAAYTILHILGRAPSDTELRRAESFISDYSPGEDAAAWAAFARVLFSTNEFLYIE